MQKRATSLIDNYEEFNFTKFYIEITENSRYRIERL